MTKKADPDQSDILLQGLHCFAISSANVDYGTVKFQFLSVYG